MIHDGMTMTYGGQRADAPAQHADLLNKVSDNIADMYAVRAGGGTAERLARHHGARTCEDGTWFTGLEAVEAGLADSVSGDDESDDPDVEDRARRILSHLAGAPAYVARERTPEGLPASPPKKAYEKTEDVPEEPALDPRLIGMTRHEPCSPSWPSG
jgi:enoyl-CoA hydratase/carnithine racemase